MENTRATTKVLIVGGGGTIGSSTALHLVRAGYTPSNLVVLDPYPIPSAQSAGNDLNKIMGIRVTSPMEMQLSLEAAKMWKEDDLFKPWFHSTGRMDCETSKEGIATLRREYETLVEAGLGASHEWLDSEDEILHKVPLLPRENIQGWKALYSHDGGWLAAASAITAIGEFLRAQGVHFHSGSAGTFKAPLFHPTNPSLTCIGVETQDGTHHHADQTVLAAGAWTPVLVDLLDQCCSKAWVYAHLALDCERGEAAPYKDIPVVYHGDIGFFLEPQPSSGIVKVCDEFPGFTRYKHGQRPYGAPAPVSVSVPRSQARHPTDTYPDASEVSIRRAIATYMPQFKDSELVKRALCWCTDTADSNLLVCEYPGWSNFFVATGDSGHTFKLLPVIGKYVVELLEGRLSDEMAHAWRWRPGTGDARKSTRAAQAKDLADMPGWKHDEDV